MTLLELASAQLTDDQVRELRALFDAAFAGDEHGGFEDDDWQHALGGTHFVLTDGQRIICHASVVERELHVGGRPLRTGYVEAVATLPERQREGHGTRVMNAVNEHVREGYQLGALGTGSQSFYERLGWQIWQGPSHVRAPDGLRPTPDEDGYIMVLRTPSTPPITLREPISCDWRSGDVW